VPDAGLARDELTQRLVDAQRPLLDFAELDAVANTEW
jgi:hypothetical protein